MIGQHLVDGIGDGILQFPSTEDSDRSRSSEDEESSGDPPAPPRTSPAPKHFEPLWLEEALERFWEVSGAHGILLISTEPGDGDAKIPCAPVGIGKLPVGIETGMLVVVVWVGGELMKVRQVDWVPD